MCPKNYLFCIATNFLPQLFDIFTQIYLPYLWHYAALYVLHTSLNNSFAFDTSGLENLTSLCIAVSHHIEFAQEAISDQSVALLSMSLPHPPTTWRPGLQEVATVHLHSMICRFLVTSQTIQLPLLLSRDGGRVCGTAHKTLQKRLKVEFPDLLLLFLGGQQNSSLFRKSEEGSHFFLNLSI